ncbi:CelD/BcsL family acetyltransferase involved in cellulose biosynthesis [Rhizomicrobium palustre]|uniref:CelD/BcsL family acetyltransferase involved in cellulose biosynthesis n=1 Tax=Rhizomicrobium palustre TaxID=189966 RepID=A0A846MWU9_9PROT|nr:GNAT family N-acetyltransferase [Rhizomicrobium palustre]NIK88028.1 CelD/BcsL family acetyltransferase involved in cellulose biosynthesis [Rhizomicrobium palustre]
MNFYATPAFLDAAAAVYFKDRSAAIEDVRIGEDVLRLLVVDGKTIVTRLLFLDYHQPLAPHEIRKPVRAGRYAQSVSRGVMEAEDWKPELFADQELAPYVDLTRFDSFAAYYEHLLSLHHGLVRDRERRARALIAKHGALSFTYDDTRPDVITKAAQWKGDQLREFGFPDIFENPQTLEFFAELRKRERLVCSSLRAGERLVSAWIGFVQEASWSGWVFAYDPSLRKYSVGHQLLIRMIEESFRRQHREFDFSAVAQDYKMFYATHGRLIGAIGKPTLKRATELYARKILRQHRPELFAAMLRAKSAVQAALRRRHPALVEVRG